MKGDASPEQQTSSSEEELELSDVNSDDCELSSSPEYKIEQDSFMKLTHFFSFASSVLVTRL